jgi:ribonuclease G
MASSGFEPLPGETISKWRNPPPPAAEPVAFAPPTVEADAEEDVEEENAEEAAIAEMDAADDAAQDAAEDAAAESGEEQRDIVAELSQEEAASLAQHVAETQIEQGTAEVQDESHDGNQGEGHESDEDEEDDELASFAQAGLSELAESEQHAGPAEEMDAEAEVRESLLAFDTGDDIGNVAQPDAGNRENQPPTRAAVRGDSRSRLQHPARRGGRDRGGRHDRGGHQRNQGHRHGAPHRGRPQLIADMLKQGQEIIVQIAKEPLGKKGARITSHVALPGRYLVYMPTLHHTGVSRKIASAEERSRLRHLVNDAKGSAGGGFIVRTAAASAPPEDVRTDVEFLTKTWSDIKSRSEQRKAPSLLHRDLNLVERILRDFVNNDFGAIWVDSEEEYTKVVDFMSRFQPGLVGRVKLYTKETPVFEEFGIQQEIDKGLKPKVWLKSGGYIVINHTEALVAIDVNTGKFVGKGSNRLEDTIVKTNLEAVKEIVRQMRLRDLGGIIVIDFIDMEERRNREKVMAALEDALRADRAPSKVLRFNEFGLVAITRKRTKQALERTLCQPCPYCTGSGMVKSIPTLCYEIQSEARKMAPDMESGSLTLRVHPEISKALKTRESGLVEELERWTKKSVIIQGDPSLHWEQYDIY